MNGLQHGSVFCKTIKHFGVICILMIGTIGCFSQGFINLDFEQANNLGIPGSFQQLVATNAFPGWTALASTANIFYDYLTYDNVNLANSSVNIMDTNAVGLVGYNPVIEGDYTVVLQGTFVSAGGIFQTGLIPASTATLLFAADGISQYSTLSVSLNGQNLNYLALSTGSNYTLYGADVSAFAGQIATLAFSSLFTIPAGSGVVALDNIQFSSSPVPEPGVIGLSAFGGLFLAWRRWRNAS